jgi:hypothetical protein
MTAPMTQGQRLAADAAAAAEVRSYQTDPDVVALQIERVRSQVEQLMWIGMVLGLAFTMVNVQQFAAADAVVWSLAWCAAWLLDPMVSLVLLGVLRAEQVTARWQVNMGPWPRVAKWALLSATYVMNTWARWATGSPSGIMLHSVPVVTVFVAAEAVTDCQEKLTECVHRAHAWTTERAQRRARVERDTQTDAEPTVPITEAARPAAPRQASRPVTRRAPIRTKAGRRVLFADYLTIARHALTPNVEITAAWVREVTGCSRGLSSRLAAALRAEHTPVPTVTPVAAERTADQPETTDQPEGKAA